MNVVSLCSQESPALRTLTVARTLRVRRALTVLICHRHKRTPSVHRSTVVGVHKAMKTTMESVSVCSGSFVVNAAPLIDI